MSYFSESPYSQYSDPSHFYDDEFGQFKTPSSSDEDDMILGDCFIRILTKSQFTFLQLLRLFIESRNNNTDEIYFSSSSSSKSKKAKIDSLLFSIDGPISSGKTTIGKELETLLGSRLLFLPETGHEDGILEKWLTKPVEYSPLFQMHMHSMCCARMMVAESEKASGNRSLIVIDRSKTGNCIIALTNTVLTEQITSSHFDFYKTVYRASTPITFGDGQDLSIYLWVKASTCLERCKTRGNDCEKDNYTIEYYKKIEQMGYLAILSNLSQDNPKPFLMIDHNAPSLNMDDFYDILSGYINFILTNNNEDNDYGDAILSSSFSSSSSSSPSSSSFDEDDHLPTKPSTTTTTTMKCPVKIILSYNACENIELYDATFDYSNLDKDKDDFFSYENLSSVYDVISYKNIRGEISPSLLDNDKRRNNGKAKYLMLPAPSSCMKSDIQKQKEMKEEEKREKSKIPFQAKKIYIRLPSFISSKPFDGPFSLNIQ